MSTTHTKRGAGAKFLALLASLTMMIAGLVGVALAAPASAVNATGYDTNAYPGLNVCPQNTDGWSSHQSANDLKSWTLSVPGKLITEICVKAGSEQQGDGPAKVLFPAPADEVTFGHPTGKDISHFSYKAIDAPKEVTFPLSDSDSAVICYEDDTITVEWSAEVVGKGADETAAENDAKAKLALAMAAAKDKAFQPYGDNYTEGKCAEDVEVPLDDFASMDICYDDENITVEWSAEVIGYGSNEDSALADAESKLPAAMQAAKVKALSQYEGYTEGKCPVTVAEASITCSAWSVDIQTLIPVDPEQNEGLVSTRAVPGTPVVVKIDGETVFTGELDKDGNFSESGVIEPPFADDATHTLTVEVDGNVVTTATSAVCTSPPPSNPPSNPPTGNPPVDTPQPLAAQVVEEPVVVAAPEAATVAAPAPATVAVPAAATLPAAVPAGEGSGNGLPMWALAMIALGMIGAAFAGKQLLGARK